MGKVTWVKVEVPPPLRAVGWVEFSCSVPVWIKLMVSAFRRAAVGAPAGSPGRCPVRDLSGSCPH
ncbi:hypothetical protein GCM10009639_23750 [Kitasatospora putterlickiae]|uniref:Uncharacterized protein n=1 Tax=Kitasatospora putterlickiae TaxID=221725 RepID=A0ABN1XX88_9ACTN